MRLRDLGEFGLIERIERAARRGPTGRDVVLGIGDDAAILRPRSGEDVVVTTDALVERVHFRFETEDPKTVGRRALVASLSDLAAMGARPLGCTLALSAPPDLPVATVEGIAAGILREARAHECPLVGGNIARSPEVNLTVTAVGAVARGRALRRTGARKGDRIFVTGTLGGAALAVAQALRGLGPVCRVAVPRLAAGRALGRMRGVGACIDVSDGLDADLAHLLAAAGLAAEVADEAIPRPRGFAAACARIARDPSELARTGGEDYELLFTLRPGAPSEAALSRRLGVRVSDIGRVIARTGRVGARRPGGFRHF